MSVDRAQGKGLLIPGKRVTVGINIPEGGGSKQICIGIDDPLLEARVYPISVRDAVTLISGLQQAIGIVTAS